MSSSRIRRVAAVALLAFGLLFLPVAAQALPMGQPTTTVSVDDSGDLVSWFLSTVAGWLGIAPTGPAEMPDTAESRTPDQEEQDLGPGMDISGSK